MVVPRVYVRRGTTVWRGTDIRLTQDALTLIFLYLYTIGPKGAIMGDNTNIFILVQLLNFSRIPTVTDRSILPDASGSVHGQTPP